MENLVDLVSGPLEAHAVRIATRKRQKLSLTLQPDESLYLIRKGIFLARAPIPHARHQILGLLYPGDFVRASALPPLDGVEITAASEIGEVWRLRWSVVKDLLEERSDLARLISDRLSDQAARTTLHNAVIAGLTGDERVAALLLELALRTGRETPAGLLFEMPLSRVDIAEHLALNADTVSRIVSRMRSKGLFAAAGRSRLLCPRFDDLARACPLTSAIARMHGGAAMPTLAV
jgi:CRP/FNR family transcriptional regulator